VLTTQCLLAFKLLVSPWRFLTIERVGEGRGTVNWLRVGALIAAAYTRFQCITTTVRDVFWGIICMMRTSHIHRLCRILALKTSAMRAGIRLAQVWAKTSVPSRIFRPTARSAASVVTMATPEPAPKTDDAPPAQPDASSDPLVASILSNFVEQYETKDTKKQDSIIASAYTPDAVFDDNLFHVNGHKNIQVQFHAVAKLFGSVKVTPTHTTIEPQGGDAGGSIIKCYNLQLYTIGKRQINIECDTTFKVDTNGKITSHYDKWRGRWANFGITKRLGGTFTSLIMRAIKY
jgi:hypothetical protein